MIGRLNCIIKKILISLVILNGLAVSLYSQDKQISGIINVYRRVDAIGPGLDNVTLNRVDSISPGDTVLLIQMQGVGIVTDQNSYGSAVQSKFGEPGGYEFLLVQSVDLLGGTKKVVFRNNILNTFDIKGNVQLIRVPYFNSATVTGKLTSRAWDNVEKVGGVLAMILGRKLKLNADIDLSGKGFWGGIDTIGIGECVMTNPVVNNHDSYPRSWLNAGYKGEGIAMHDQSGALLAPLHVKGQGINLTGGGGGNGKYSGGGGGSNRGKGGDGTSEKNLGIGLCADPQPGAYGGTTVIPFLSISNGIFFGGGGGSSTHASGSAGSSGGNGGGIVIIVGDTISGNLKSIKAEGASAGNAISDGGAGGGGAGGSVIISMQSFSELPGDSLKISVKGGNGGINPGGFGNGGGGGGGLLWVSTATIPAKVPVNFKYGTPGPASLSEGNGEKKYNFSPKLNGFLFNSIRSKVTGDQVDSICSNVPFGLLTGTKPVGGKAPHTYLWQSSTTSESSGFSDAAGTNNEQDYSPGLLTQTTWFRRVVTDNDSPALIDYSKPVKIIVQPFIENNIIGKPDTICFNGDPPLIQQLVPDLIVPTTKHLFFNWQDSTSVSAFGSTVATTKNFDPAPGLIKTTWYRRTVTSGRCVDKTAIAKITVLDTISNNKILSLPQEICSGSVFTDLSGTISPALAGGDNSYRFSWESNINGAGWGPAPGVRNTADYNPVELFQRIPLNEYYFRRVVSSGMHDVCLNTSAPVILKDFPAIGNNTITGNQVICSGAIPGILTGSQPINGNGIYAYSWQDSTKSHTWAVIPGVTSIDYQPPALTDTSSYRRIVSSSACTDISKSITIIVHKPILNNNITLLAGALTDTTICNGAVPNMLKGTIAAGGTNIPGNYAYKWIFSGDNTNWNPVPSAGTGPSYYPSALTSTTYYKRQVISGACSVVSSATIKITVLPLISNNVISANQTVCYNTIPALLTGAPLSGGAGIYSFLWEQSVDGGVTWILAAGINNSSSGSYQPPALTLPMKYKRIVKSGANDCCIDISNIVNIGIHQLPTGSIISTLDTTICEGSKVRLKVQLTGASQWKVTYKENAAQFIINNISGPVTTFFASPVSGAAFTTFNYSLFSVEDQNGCLATSLTGSRKADVYKVPLPNAGNDTTVCGSQVKLKATPSAGTGKWYENSILLGSTPSLMVTVNPIFLGGNVKHTFTWEEINWQCKNKDSVKITFDKNISSVNPAGSDTVLYTFDNIIRLGAQKQSWETGNWSVVSGTGDFADASNPITIVENLSKGVNTFLWKITNGSCTNEDMINIDVYELVIPKGFSPNNDPDNNTFMIRGLDLPNQQAELTIVNGAGTEVFSTSNRDGQEWVDWDGKGSNGIDYPEGTYYYLLKITSNGNGQVFKRSGFIVLKRY